MTGILAAFAGSGRGVVRDPITGDYYDANNRVTINSYTGGSPPFSSYFETIFRWGGVNIATVVNPYPEAATTSVVVGSYTYYLGTFKSSSGSEPVINLYGIYRIGPPA